MYFFATIIMITLLLLLLLLLLFEFSLYFSKLGAPALYGLSNIICISTITNPVAWPFHLVWCYHIGKL